MHLQCRVGGGHHAAPHLTPLRTGCHASLLADWCACRACREGCERRHHGEKAAVQQTSKQRGGRYRNMDLYDEVQ